MAAASSPSFVTDYTFLRGANDAVPRSVPHIQRPAKFWYGASLTFRIEESINVLHTEIPSCNFYEAIGILHDVRLVLNEANDMMESVSSESVKELQDRFEDLALHVQYCFHDHLTAAKATEPDQPLTDKSLQAWFDATNAFINNSQPFAVAWSFEESWRLLRECVIVKYHKCMRQVISSQAICGPHDADEAKLPSISPPTFKFGTSGPHLTEKSPDQEVLSVFKSVVDFYRYWCGQGTSDETVAKVCTQLKVLQRTIEILLGHPPGSQETLKDKHINEKSQLIYIGWCNHFRHTFGRLIAERLASRQSHLEATIQDEQDLEIAERQVFLLARDLRAASFNKPEGACRRVWSDWTPYMLSPETYDASMLRLQQVSTDLQDRLSASCELKRVWFDLYKSLATTYIILSEANFVFPDTEFPLERMFFLDTVHQRQFRNIMREPVVVNPMIVENVVAQYCIKIAQARAEIGSETGGVRRYSTNELKQTEKRVNDAYHQNLVWQPIAIRVMQKMAVRLNYLTGGPGYIRRAHPEYKYWEIDHVKFSVPTSIHPSITLESDRDEHQLPYVSHEPLASGMQLKPARVRFATDREHSNNETSQGTDKFDDLVLDGTDTPLLLAKSRSMVESLPERIRLTGADVSSADTKVSSSFSSWGGLFAPHDTSDISTKDLSGSVSQLNDPFPEPFGFDQISSFDYVSCPFPETRAIEVALSHQISRELSDKNIGSFGPKVEDVLNRPPRHVQKPGQISVIGRYLPYGPWDLLKTLWQAPKKLRSAKPRSSITSRRSHKSIKNKRDGILSPRKDTFRVAKPSDSQPPIARTPKLRGGGIARPDVQGYIRMLIDRTSGIWDVYSQPTEEELITRFLQPAEWDVWRAVENVRRIYDRNSTGNTPNRTLPDTRNAAFSDIVPSSFASQSLPENPDTQPDEVRINPVFSLPGGTGTYNANPENFMIFQDPSSRSSRNVPAWPGPSSASIPAGNQDHEAQRQADRLRAQQGLPPQRRSDNPSSQENRAPIIWDIDSISSDSDQDRYLQAPRCTAVSCHRCPVFQNQYHHVCAELITNQHASASPPLPGADIPIPSIEGREVSVQVSSSILSFSANGHASPSPGSHGWNDQNSGNSANGSRQRSEIPDSQDEVDTHTSQTHATSVIQADTSTVSQASTPTAQNTTRGRGASRARGRGRGRGRGSRTQASSDTLATTRMTRGRLAQINAQQGPGSSITLAQAQARIQTQLNAQSQTQGGGPMLIGLGTNQTPATQPAPVTPIRGRGNARRGARGSTRGAIQPSPPRPQTGATQGNTARRARNHGRAGFWGATSRGSPTSPNTGHDRADLSDPTARHSPTPPLPTNPVGGQLSTARHPHHDSDDDSSGEASRSDDDSPTAGDTRTNNPYNLNRPPIPSALRPQRRERTTRAAMYRMRQLDPFAFTPPPNSRPSTATTRSVDSATTATTNRDLTSIAVAAVGAMDTRAHTAYNLLPPYTGDQPLASTNIAANPSARRGNSDPSNRRTRATGNVVADGGSTGTAARTRGGSEGTTRGMTRRVPNDFDDDLRLSQRRRR